MKQIFSFVAIVLFSGFFITQSLIGQEKITVRAKGSFISRDLTPEQTKARAIEEAKREALLKAGISETIAFTDFSYQFEDNEKFQEIFQVISSIETGGEIIVDTILHEDRRFNEFGNMEVEVEIEATVYKHVAKADPGFRFKIKGVDEVYKNNDYLLFNFTPAKEGYLKIFNITDEETSLLYPFSHPTETYLNEDPEYRFKKRKEVQFPMHPAFDHGYALEIIKPDKEQEFNILLFVYTKDYIPFLDEVSFKNIMKWIYSIPPDQRVTEQVGFIIKKKL
nr:hypothetical protein [Bacteroidota bacterium]